MSRTGKISRLPRPIRDELSVRLENGETGVRLAEWLNGLPDVLTVLARDFGGRPITVQNLSEWKARGHAAWQARQEALAQARDLAADARELTDATDGKLTDHLATVVAARYTAALARWNGETDAEFSRQLRTLHGLCADVVELRRGDHSGARLDIERERLERERERDEEEIVEQFKRWIQIAPVRDWICADTLSLDEKAARLRELFGLAPKPPEQASKPDTDEPPEDENQTKSK